MENDKLDRFEAAMGAISKITSDDPEMVGARCPKCDASDFIAVSDLYSETVGRLEEQPDLAHAEGPGGMTNLAIVEKFRPARRKSAAGMVILVAVPLAGVSFYLYRRFGDLVGQGSGVAAFVITMMVFMTTLRRNSDRYYHARQRRNRMFMCRKCGQLVA